MGRRDSSRVDPAMDGVLWKRTSAERPAARPAPDGDSEADLIVVGGGFAGLSIALHAARAGLSVCVLEAGIVGNGASGRNGGFAVPHFPGAIGISDVEQRLGKAKAERLATLVAEGPTRMFEQIREYDIACDPSQSGWTQPAHSPKSLAKIRRLHDEWKAFGAPVQWLDGDEVRERLGAATYIGGWHNATGGTVQPYALTLGLARAATTHGAAIHENSPVRRIDRENGRPVAHGDGFAVRGRKLVIATNGYTGRLLPDLERTGISVRLFHCATEPLTAEQRRSVLPDGGCFTDLRRSGGFSRYDASGRLLAGGAVFSVGVGRAVGLAHARRRTLELFPQLSGAPLRFESYWEGYCSITDSFLPSLQVLGGEVYSLLGFSTRGVALSQNLGRVVGEFLAGRRDLSDVPVQVVDGAQTIANHGVKTAVGRVIFPMYQMMDRLRLS